MTSTQVEISRAIQPGPFRNEPFTDFRQPENADKMRRALERVRAQLGREYDLIIGGRTVKTKEKITSINPSNPKEVIGIFQKAGAGEVSLVMDAALRAFESWKQVPVEQRAQLLLRFAGLMRERKFELEAWMVVEVGKNWAEADADIGEAIDFCEFYAREALRLAKAEPPIQYPGRARLPVVYPAWRGRGNSTVEFPAGDHRRYDYGFDCLRKHGGSEAFKRCAGHRRQAGGAAVGVRHARWRS